MGAEAKTEGFEVVAEGVVMMKAVCNYYAVAAPYCCTGEVAYYMFVMIGTGSS